MEINRKKEERNRLIIDKQGEKERNKLITGMRGESNSENDWKKSMFHYSNLMRKK